MKKIIFILIAVFALTACKETKAQVAQMYSNTDTSATGAISTVTTKTSDTLYDASTIYTMYTKTGALNAATSCNYLVTFETVKISGTGTANVYLQGSTDGVTWRNMNARMIGTDGVNSDTLSIAAASTTATGYAYYSVTGMGVYRPATNTGTFWVPGGRVFYLRLKIVASGTQATIYRNAKVYTFIK